MVTKDSLLDLMEKIKKAEVDNKIVQIEVIPSIDDDNFTVEVPHAWWDNLC